MIDPMSGAMRDLWTQLKDLHLLHHGHAQEPIVMPYASFLELKDEVIKLREWVRAMRAELEQVRKAISDLTAVSGSLPGDVQSFGHRSHSYLAHTLARVERELAEARKAEDPL